MKGIPSISQYGLTTLLAGITMMLSACSSSNEEYKWESWETTGNEATVSVQTENGGSELLEAGTTIGVYVVDENGKVTWVNATVDQYGNVVLPQEALTGKTIVYTPVQPGWGMAAFSSTPSFYVKPDQSDEEGYEDSDLMIGTATASAAARAFTRASTSVNITLKHMMAKVIVHVVDETGMMDFRTAVMSLLHMKNGVTVSLPEQSVTTIENSISDIEMQAYSITDRRLSMRAIVAPQTKEAGEELFELVIPGSCRLCVLPSKAVITAEQAYVYQVRYTEDGPVLESSYITNWDSAEEEADFTIRTDK